VSRLCAVSHEFVGDSRMYVLIGSRRDCDCKRRHVRRRSVSGVGFRFKGVTYMEALMWRSRSVGFLMRPDSLASSTTAKLEWLGLDVLSSWICYTGSGWGKFLMRLVFGCTSYGERRFQLVIGWCYVYAWVP
jgi:hypothetical protein